MIRVNHQEMGWVTILAYGVAGIAFVCLLTRIISGTRWNNSKRRLPPRVPYWIPFLGSIVRFGLTPEKFMAGCHSRVCYLLSFE